MTKKYHEKWPYNDICNYTLDELIEKKLTGDNKATYDEISRTTEKKFQKKFSN